MQPFNLLKRSFVRQAQPEDCGLACLAMIFHYNGKTEQVKELRNSAVGPGGFNLLELRNLARQFQLPCHCVEMEIDYLRTITTPCILHTITEHGQSHYQVCYGSRHLGKQRCFLMADPAKQVYYLEEKLLLQQWETRTALYFDCLEPNLTAFKRSGWGMLWSFQIYPAGVLLSVPLLSLFGASFSVALSWLLQKGLSNDVLVRGHLIFVLLALLLLISLFRSGLSFLRQFLLIKINLFQQTQLSRQLLDRVYDPLLLAKRNISRKAVKDNLDDIQRIVNATSSFIAVMLSEGALVITMICAIGVFLPAAAFINFVYLTLVSFLLYKRIRPASHAATHLSYFSRATENILLKDIDHLQAFKNAQLLETRKKVHLKYFESQLKYAKAFAFSTGKFIFLIEAFGTINVIVVFVTCLYQLNNLMLSYSDLMVTVILSYISSSLMPKIGGTLMQIADGADASVQLKAFMDQKV